MINRPNILKRLAERDVFDSERSARNRSPPMRARLSDMFANFITGKPGDYGRENPGQPSSSSIAAMLATQLNNLVSNGELDQNSVIRLDKYVCNPIQDRKVMILLEVTVMARGADVGKKLGDPVPYKPGAVPKAQPAQQSAQPSKDFNPVTLVSSLSATDHKRIGILAAGLNDMARSQPHFTQQLVDGDRQVHEPNQNMKVLQANLPWLRLMMILGRLEIPFLTPPLPRVVFFNPPVRETLHMPMQERITTNPNDIPAREQGKLQVSVKMAVKCPPTCENYHLGLSTPVNEDVPHCKHVRCCVPDNSCDPSQHKMSKKSRKKRAKKPPNIVKPSHLFTASEPTSSKTSEDKENMLNENKVDEQIKSLEGLSIADSSTTKKTAKEEDKTPEDYSSLRKENQETWNGNAQAKCSKDSLDGAAFNKSRDGLRTRPLQHCWGCRKQERVPKAFKKCGKCKEAGYYLSRYYCSTECQPAEPEAPKTPQQNRVPMQNMNNKPGGGNFYSNKNTGGAFSVQNVPNTPGGTPTRVHPISSLTPYQNRWTIRARVSQKSSIRTWSNSRGEGKLFSMNLIDESGEIKATAFKEQVDKFYEMVEVNKVYYLSKGTLKTADKRYSSVANDYEMTFNHDTQMWQCEEETNLPTVQFNFVPINQLDSHEPNSMIDVVGVVKQADDLNTVMGKASQREIKKRDVHLVDDSQVQIRLTLWGNDAENFKGDGNPVLAVKGARLSDWNGRSLSALASSQILINPDNDDAHRLRGWWDSVGRTVEYSEYKSDRTGSGGQTTNWKTFADVKEEPLGGDQALYYSTKATIVSLRKENSMYQADVKEEPLGGDQALYYSTKATIVSLRKENSMYQACPSADCNKKVIDQSNGTYRCEKCQKEYPDFKWRMILSCNLADFSDNQWVTFFQDTAETILGKKANELGQMRTDAETEYDQVFHEANFKSYIFKFRAKVETYNDETRLKTVGLEAKPLDYKEYNTKLISDIEALLAA